VIVGPINDVWQVVILIVQPLHGHAISTPHL